MTIQRTNKYHRTISNIASADGEQRRMTVDVYRVLKAFGVNCPARQHAIKKLLCAGLRGKNDELSDLKETIQAVEESIAMAEQDLQDKRDQRGDDDSATSSSDGSGSIGDGVPNGRRRLGL